MPNAGFEGDCHGLLHKPRNDRGSRKSLSFRGSEATVGIPIEI